MPRILLIDDDEALAPPLAQYLARFDFELVAAVRPSEGLQRLQTESFDALILDGMLPEVDGFEFCKRLRAGNEAWRHLPVLMLSARGDLTDRVVGLELGADDYLAKPFEPRELAARLQSLLRRALQPSRGLAAQGTAKLKRFDGLNIDLDRREVRVANEAREATVDLTSTEYELLLMLATQPGKVFGRDEILNHLRGQEADLYTRSVDILVSRLRKKLAPLDAVKTLRNAGYCLALAPRA
ncbi:response regulator transcription factor [Aquabacterium sp.]|uniref:response regulator transcription factor n=1 Tax=Aquabacterium sp. TaxID=1872578 RepID=UPI003D6CEAFB